MKKIVSLAILGLVLAFSSSAHSAIVTKTNTTPGQFDQSSGTRTVSFDATADFANIPVNTSNIVVAITFQKLATGGGRPFYDEVAFSLTSPTGQTIQLISNASGGASFDAGNPGDPGFNGTLTFEQSAAQVVNFNRALIPNTPETNYRPVAGAGFNPLIGLNPVGTWTLNINDRATPDPLVFTSYSITITAVPEPSSLSILGLAALGMVTVRRRRG